MSEQTINVTNEELLEWLSAWGEIKEGDTLLSVMVGYGSTEFIVGKEGED